MDDQHARHHVPPNDLKRFRDGLYACFTRWADALFEAGDAVLCAPGPVRSVPSLSLEPEFTRSHGSLYKALARGEIDDEAMRDAAGGAPPRTLAAGVRGGRLDLGSL